MYAYGQKQEDVLSSNQAKKSAVLRANGTGASSSNFANVVSAKLASNDSSSRCEFHKPKQGLAPAQSQASLAESETELQKMLVSLQHLRNRVNQTKSQRNILKHKLQRNQEMQGLLGEETGNQVETVSKLEDSIRQHQLRVQEEKIGALNTHGLEGSRQ